MDITYKWKLILLIRNTDMNEQCIKQMKSYNLTYLRKAKADAIEMIYKRGIPCKDNLCVERYEQATVLPCTLTKDGDMWTECMAGVVDQDDAVIPISCTWPFTSLNHPIVERKYSEENVIYIGSFRSHWGHFLIDLVPRLWYVLECNKDKIDAFIISGEFYGSNEIQIANIREFLELFGILDKVKMITIPTVFNSVIIPEKAYISGKALNDSCEKHVFSDRYFLIFNYIANKVIKSYKKRTFPKRIFMTRGADIDYGIELLNNFFENNDYFILDPAEVTLTELIVLLNQCEKVAYISGTLQHNMLFAPNGKQALAIESRAYVSPIQIDIDIMKDIDVTYIDANYSIVKDFRIHSRLYGYTSCFKRYVADKKMKKPNVLFLSHEYLQKNIKKHLYSYYLPDILRFKYIESEYSGYEVTVCQESISEISQILNLNIDISYNNFFDRKSISAENLILMKTLKIPYGKWKENTYSELYQTFINLIQYAIKQKNLKKFMIYPYGRNGLLCKIILKEVFEIDPIVFDNKICQYNTSVFPLKNLKQMQKGESVMILTSVREECVKEIERYCEPEMIFGPYTIY